MTIQMKVGAFVILSLSLLTFTLVYLINSSARGANVPYRTYLRYAGGLEPGTPVFFGGINAGKVTAVHPWTSDPTRIEILMDFKTGTPVNEKSVAKLGSLSLMSGPALLISTGTNEARRIPPGQIIPSQETVSMDEIVAKVSVVADSAHTLITQVQGELANISGDARTLLANLNTVTGRPNQELIHKTLDEVSVLVANERPKIDHLIEQLSALTEHTDGVVASAGPAVEHADGTIQNVNDMVSEMRDPIHKDLVELQSTLQEAKNLLASIQVLIRANDARIGDTLENLRTTTENLNQLTDSVKQRPFSLIRVKQPAERKVPK